MPVELQPGCQVEPLCPFEWVKIGTEGSRMAEEG